MMKGKIRFEPVPAWARGRGTVHLRRYIIDKEDNKVTVVTIPHEYFTGQVDKYHVINGEVVSPTAWKEWQHATAFQKKITELINE